MSVQPAIAEAEADEVAIGLEAVALQDSSSRNDPRLLEDAIRQGMVGAMLNVMDKEAVDRLQQIAVEESRLGIPLIFGRDVIHGFRTRTREGFADALVAAIPSRRRVPFL